MALAPSLAERIHSCVFVRQEPIGVVVRVRYDEAPLGVRVHTGARDAAVRLLLTRSGGEVLERSRSCRFDPAETSSAQALADTIRRRLTKIARRPISGRRTEQILRISAEERRRWTRDGRLPPHGQSRMRTGGREIILQTYDPEAVEALADMPAELAAWRARDARLEGLAGWEST